MKEYIRLNLKITEFEEDDIITTSNIEEPTTSTQDYTLSEYEVDII